MQHRAVVCGFLRVTWEALNVAQGQTAGRQVEDNNGNNDHSFGSRRRHRDHSVLRRSTSCPLKKKKIGTQDLDGDQGWRRLGK